MILSSPAIAESAPPDFADSAHLPNGCYLSAVAYLARFGARYPFERGEPLAVTLLNGDGAVKPHTVAMVTWRGRWWGRDEYFGVFPIGAPAIDDENIEGLRHRAERALERQAASRRAASLLARMVEREAMPPARREAELERARALVPFPSKIIRFAARHGEVPFLFFRPAENEIAVYDPSIGTATAVCRSEDGAAVVATVARRMGYKPGVV